MAPARTYLTLAIWASDRPQVDAQPPVREDDQVDGGDPIQMIAEGDAMLVGALRRGEAAAFEALYKRHAGAVATVAKDHVRDSDRVAEVVQETFARALESLPRLKNADRFRPWLLSIARHTAVDARRKDACLLPELLDTVDDLPTAGPSPQELAELAELVGVVRGALTGLSRRDATAIALVALGFGVADVAVALGIEHGAAKVALHRARRRLKARVLVNMLPHRDAGACAELGLLPATDLLAIARHLGTCDTCVEAARAVLA